MTCESIAFLNANRYHYDYLKATDSLKQIDHQTRDGILQVIRREWDAGYITSPWCGECVMNMVRFAYVQYDKWIAEQQTVN